MGKRLAKKVLLIGWDAADWKVINPLLDAGQMPALEKLVNGGVIGNLATLDPPLSPMLWSSIATGKRPFKHGILGFTEPAPDGNGIRPVLGSSRKVKAIWNILTQHEMKTHVVGWWPSHPAEPINGICISNFYAKAYASIGEQWNMNPGTVHPEDKSDFFSKLRIHPGELTQAHLLPFVPDAASVDQDNDKGIATLSKILAECSTIQAASTYILENEPWDFAAFYFDSIDHFCHSFMKFHPPKMDKVNEKSFNLYKDVVAGGYKFHDMMLERLVQLAGSDATIILISDHGFHPDHLRPVALPKEPAAPALEHSPYGIICMNGPGIKKDERIYGASILDITPTILSLFGLPVGEDMDGMVLSNAFIGDFNPETIASWENIAGESGMHPPEIKDDPLVSKNALDQLVDLGYIEKPDENAKKALQSTINENNYYLARSYMDARKYEDAIPILDKLFTEYPDQKRFGMRLATCYQNVGKLEEFKKIVLQMKDLHEKELDQKPSPWLFLMQASLLLHENKFKEAVELYKKVEEITPNLPSLHLQIGRGYMHMKKWNEAERAYRKELGIDYENPATHHGLGLTQLRKGENEKAAESFLNAIGLTYHFPFAHYHLGEALFNMGDYHGAAKAFEVCLRMAPNINKARQWLIRIYEDFVEEPEKAAFFKEDFNEHIKGTITVVSGLPRSGTSMMMQMLANGGMEIFSDNIRNADESNPKGYYEHEGVKRLARDKRWLKDSVGKTVKIISHLLFHLPANYHYKIIFMERDIDEIINSQQKMLAKDGKIKQNEMPFMLKNAFEQNLAKVKQWHSRQNGVEILYVNHAEVMRSPLEQAEKINSFLGGKLDIELMTSAVDVSLHREKVKKIS